MIRNLVIVGMGGQGVKLLSTLVRRAIGRQYGRFSGFDERGGAQRYGPVAALIRFSDDTSYAGPLGIDCADGSVDWLVALEAGELLRFSDKLSPRSLVLSDTVLVPPTNLRREDSQYFTRAQLEHHLESIGCAFRWYDFRDMAVTVSGRAIDANLVALGALLFHLGGVVDCAVCKELCEPRQYRLICHGLDVASGASQ